MGYTKQVSFDKFIIDLQIKWQYIASYNIFFIYITVY